MVKVLFVCYGNSCRSQMAEALAGGDCEMLDRIQLRLGATGAKIEGQSALSTDPGTAPRSAEAAHLCNRAAFCNPL
jgi:protein-tyrosine-phosphatase